MVQGGVDGKHEIVPGVCHMVKDKTKDGAVPGMVESKVNKNVRTKEKLSEKVRGIEFMVCFILIY